MAHGVFQARGTVGDVVRPEDVAGAGQRRRRRSGTVRVAVLYASLDPRQPAGCLVEILVDHRRDAVGVITQRVEQVVEGLVVQRDARPQ